MLEHTRPSADPLEARLEFETLLSDLSSRFINLPPAEVGRAIEEAQRRVCESLGLDLSVLWEGTGSAESPMAATHVFSAPEDLRPPMVGMSAREYFPWFEREALSGRVAAFTSLVELPEEAAVDRENLRKFGVKSGLTIPLSVGGAAAVGALGFGTTRAERDWSEFLVNRLRLVAQVFANALARGHADEALRESEERLSLAADAAGAGLWTLDFDTGVFWATERGRALFGYRSDETITMERFEASVHPDDWGSVREAVERARDAGAPVSVEYRVLSPGASDPRWISSRGRPVRDPDGHVSRLTGVSLDVTARKEAERESRERLVFESLIAELSSRFVPLAPADVDASIEEALARICTTLAIDLAVLWQWSKTAPEDLIPTHSYSAGEKARVDALHQGQYPWHRQQMLAGRPCVSATLDDLPPEAAVDRENGRLMGIRSNLTLPLTVGGRPVGALAFSTLHAERAWPDELVTRLGLITQVFANTLARSQSEEALRDQKDRLQAGAELAGLGFYEVDLGGGVMWFDDRTREVCGLPPGREQGLEPLQFWMEHIHPGDAQVVLERRDDLHEGRLERIDVRYRYLHPSRGETWIAHAARVAERDAAGRAIRTFGVLRDVTAAKRTEEALHDLSRRLIRAHEEERALLARELHDDVTQRLAVLAIDLGRTELTAPSFEHPRVMGSVREGLVRLSEDVHALATQLHPTVLDQLGLAAALRAECERRGRQGPLALHLTVDPMPSGVDREVTLCLFRVAQEALNNAARHARASTVSVTLRQIDDGLLLEIHDDGVGFDPAGPRTGGCLGLASMTERVQLVRGTLDIESAPGRGTSVVVWAPLAGGSP